MFFFWQKLFANIDISLRKHPFLLDLGRWGRLARRNITLLRAKRPQLRRARRNGCFRRLCRYSSWIIERRSVWSRCHGSTIFGWQQNQRRRRRKENGKKLKGFYWQNNKFAGASSYFVYFFAVVARLRHETSQFQAPASWSRRTNSKIFVFLFLNWDTVLSNSTKKVSPTFHKLNEIK